MASKENAECLIKQVSTNSCFVLDRDHYYLMSQTVYKICVCNLKYKLKTSIECFMFNPITLVGLQHNL